MQRDEDGDIIILRSTKTRDIPVKPFAALWTYEQDEDGELIKGRLFGMGKPEGDKLSKQEQAEQCILADMADGMNQREIVDLVKREAGVGKNTTIAALRRLVDDRKLRTQEGGTNNAKRYARI